MLPNDVFFCMDGGEVGGGSRTGTRQVSVFAHECCSYVRAEGSGVVLQDSGKVSGTLGSHKEPAPVS